MIQRHLIHTERTSDVVRIIRLSLRKRGSAGEARVEGGLHVQVARTVRQAEESKRGVRRVRPCSFEGKGRAPSGHLQEYALFTRRFRDDESFHPQNGVRQLAQRASDVVEGREREGGDDAFDLR